MPHVGACQVLYVIAHSDSECELLDNFNMQFGRRRIVAMLTAQPLEPHYIAA
jgi:hypothetical protein